MNLRLLACKASALTAELSAHQKDAYYVCGEKLVLLQFLTMLSILGVNKIKDLLDSVFSHGL